MKLNKLALLLLASLTLISGCSKKPEGEDEGDVIFFNADHIINDNFGGLGVEWGTYEETKKLVPDAKERIYGAVDYLNPSLVRCMFNYDWICEDLDTKGTEDKNDDTWVYNFNNERMISCCEVLDYCQDHDINVAFGIWNVIGNADPELDEWGMMEDCTTDIRWAKMAADILTYLVKNKGYTCIKWFVNTNEPNWTGNQGSSKMFYNTYEKWEQGVRQVRAKLDEAGLEEVDIVGGDTTGFGDVALQYMEGISKNLKDTVHNYGAHFYIDNRSILTSTFQDYLTQLYDGIRANDPSLGETKDFYIWEAGLSTGKNSTTDCNSLIRNISYGFMMADYTLQAILSGINGICYWDLDDAMHFMYSDTGNTPKEWGMFSTLASAPLKDQDYRPWYYSTALLSNTLVRGAKIYNSPVSSSLRSIASVTPNNEDGSIVIVNDTVYSVDTKVLLEEEITNNEKTYVYVYNEDSLLIDGDGKLLPNIELDCSMNTIFDISIPASSLVVITSKKIGG